MQFLNFKVGFQELKREAEWKEKKALFLRVKKKIIFLRSSTESAN